jgi:hypothetical protein
MPNDVAESKYARPAGRHRLLAGVDEVGVLVASYG